MPARHDFDGLPLRRAVEVHRTQLAELRPLAAAAQRLVPGVCIGEAELARYLAFDPDCILSFTQRGKLLGGMAFLFLNFNGYQALLLDEIDLAAPDMRLLARQDEEVAAIYIWAIVLTGRGIAGLGQAAAHLRQPRFVNADCFAKPATRAGRDIMVATGFRPIPSFQKDLWRYERPWHRARGPADLQERSYADARQ